MAYRRGKSDIRRCVKREEKKRRVKKSSRESEVWEIVNREKKGGKR